MPPCLLYHLVEHLLHLDLSDSRLPANLLQPLLSSLPNSSLRFGDIQCLMYASFQMRKQVLGSCWTRSEGSREGLSSPWTCVTGEVTFQNKKSSILPVSLKSSFSSRVGLKKARLGDEQLRAILSCSLGRTRFLSFTMTFIPQSYLFQKAEAD